MRGLIPATLLTVMGMAQLGHAQDVPAAKPRIAVLPFKAAKGTPGDAVQLFSDKFLTEFRRTPMYVVLNWTDLKTLKDQQTLAAISCSQAQEDPERNCDDLVGGQLGAEKYLQGKARLVGDKVYFAVTVLDVATGKVENATDVIRATARLEDLLDDAGRAARLLGSPQGEEMVRVSEPIVAAVVFEPLVAVNPPPVPKTVQAYQTDAAFSVTVRPDRGDGSSYSVDETMVVDIEVTRDVYVKLFMVAADGTTTLIFPNRHERTNRLLRGRHRLGDAKDHFSFRMAPPYGVESLKVIASTNQFNDYGKLNQEWDAGKDFVVQSASTVAATRSFMTRGLKVDKETVYQEVREGFANYNVRENR